MVQVSCNSGLGRQIYFLSPVQISEALKWLLMSEPIGALCGMLGRISFAITLLRLLGPQDRVKRYILYGLIVIQFVGNGIFTIITYGRCGTHIRGVWDMSEDARKHCLPRSVQSDVGTFQSCMEHPYSQCANLNHTKFVF